MLAKLSARCWRLLISIFERNRSRKASAFNCLSVLDEDTCFTRLDALAKDFDFHQFREGCKEAKLCKKRSSILQVEIQERMIKVKMGQQFLLGDEVEFVLPGERVKFRPPELLQLLCSSDICEQKDQPDDVERTTVSNLCTKETNRERDHRHPEQSTSSSNLQRIRESTNDDVESDTDSSDGKINWTYQADDYEIESDADSFDGKTDKTTHGESSPCTPIFKPGYARRTYQRLQQYNRDSSFEEDTYAIPCTPPARKKISLNEYRKKTYEDQSCDSCPFDVSFNTPPKRQTEYKEKKTPASQNKEEADIPSTSSPKQASSQKSKTDTNTAFTLCEFPENVRPGDWILINPKEQKNEEGMWIGEVKSVKRKIKFDWVYNREDNIWIGGGVMRPKGAVCAIKDVLATFTYDFTGAMPSALTKELQNLWLA